MKLLTLTATLLFAGIAFAQDAKVIEISKPDAEHAAKAHQALVDAQAAWDKVRAEIGDKYASDTHLEPDYGTGNITGGNSTGTITICGQYPCAGSPSSKADEDERRKREAALPKKTVYRLKNGWYNGFEFNPDFRFIVPKIPEPSRCGGFGGTQFNIL